jgi:hypothetical protein
MQAIFAIRQRAMGGGGYRYHHIGKPGPVQRHQCIPGTARLPGDDHLAITPPPQRRQIILQPASRAARAIGIGFPVKAPDIEAGVVEMPGPAMRLAPAHIGQC